MYKFPLKFIFCLAILFLLAVPHLHADERNLLDNGDFSKLTEGLPAVWGPAPGVAASKAGPNGSMCIKIATPIAQYSVVEQYVPIDGTRVHKVRLSGMVRYQDVRRGTRDYDVLRAFIMWFDHKGLQVGGYDNAGHWTGTSGWTEFSKEFTVPPDAKRMQVLIGLHNCSGTCFFSNMKLEVSAGDKSFDPSAFAKTDTAKWWAFTAKETPAAGTPVDVSYLLDAPAGKHGFLTARNGHFYFQDGTRARFWGFDIMGSECFADHSAAKLLAERLARMGVNIVRLHHMDASWADPNIFDPRFDDTRHLSKTSMEKLDYFLYQLKQRGIYVYLDWLVNRHFKKGDGVADYQKIDDGCKIVAHFDPRMIQLQKEYMKLLLGHRNCYTGILYADEPQIALSEVINEDSLFYEDWYDRVPPRYMEELRQICRRYEPGADPAKQPFDEPTLRALYQVESKYYSEMRSYLHKLGLRCPTTGSNHWENIGPAILCDSQTDYIDRHYYWDHPKGDNYGWQQEFDNLPSLGTFDECLLGKIAGARVADKPMVVTEWCYCWVNDHIAEGPLIGAISACQQDWDVMIWFDISHALPNSAMENEFDISDKPHLFAQWAAAATMFHRQDIDPLAVERKQITRADLLKGKPLSSDVDTEDALKHQFETEIADKPSAQSLASINQPNPQVNWNINEGTMIVQSPRTIVLDGFLSGKNYGFGWVRASIKNEFCVIWLTSLDKKPLQESRHILITASARAENTGQQFNNGRTHLIRPGTTPILIEPVDAALTFAHEVTIRSLKQNGKSGQMIKSNHIELNNAGTFWYEVTR